MDMIFKTILCSVDFSRFAQHVLGYGTSLAKRFNARLIVFNTVNLPQNPLYADPMNSEQHFLGNRKALVLDRISDLMASHPSVDWEPLVAFGDPVNEAVAAAETQRADLVIAASYGLSVLKRLLVGTVVERMARSLTRPFLVVKPIKKHKRDGINGRAAISRIVVGCGFSSEFRPVLEYTEKFAETLDAQLHLLHALETPVNENLVHFSEGPYSKVQNELAMKVQERLKAFIKDPSNNVQIKISKGNPGEALIRYARKNKMDLIAVGVRFHKTLEKMIIGSTTESILRHAQCPVLVVPSTIDDA
jgi:nucleotide-binding universal stress UspA family protein